MKNFGPLLKIIPFKRNNHYKTYIQENDILILIKSQYSHSTVYRIKELVFISFLAQEYKYSCILLANGNIQIKEEKKEEEDN